jgi:hypothetical protein
MGKPNRFLRIVTNPRAFDRAESISKRMAFVRTRVDPGADGALCGVIRSIPLYPGIQGNLVPDAHLTALAVEYGLTLCSADGDFARFPELRWLNPPHSKLGTTLPILPCVFTISTRLGRINAPPLLSHFAGTRRAEVGFASIGRTSVEARDERDGS